MANPQNLQKLKLEERKKLKQIKELNADIQLLRKLITKEQKEINTQKRHADPEDVERFFRERKRYHHIDYSANRFRVSVQVDGVRQYKRFKSLDEAVKLRDEKLYGKYD